MAGRKHHYRLAFELEPELREILLAFLGELPFESFCETENGLDGFLLEDESLLASLRPSLESLQQQFPFRYRVELLPAENWNALWEANFSPLRVGKFCGVRASFHEPLNDVRHELLINPKMAFGTGHHETTYQMIAMMEEVDWAGRSVLDFGAGTAILAILAAKLGAATVDAVEIEEPAVENARENVELNGTPAVRVILGDAEAIPQLTYERILANINRNVILASLASLYQRLAPGGRLFLSGFYGEDVPILLEACRPYDLSLGRRMDKNNWSCLELLRSSRPS